MAPNRGSNLSTTIRQATYNPFPTETITVRTSRFGELEINVDEIITLPEGLLGFPEYQRYVLLDHDRDSPFKWFQSLDEGAITFVMIDPKLVDPTYHAEITQDKAAMIDLTDPDDAVVSVIITMPSNPQNMTANFKAPIVFNLKNRKGKQIILNNPAYTTRHNVMDMMRAQTEAHQ